MSDQKLRELERRWRETKSVDDEAAYLRERVRVGDLTQERLELAAYCGHEAAARLADRRPSDQSLVDFVRRLAPWRTGGWPPHAHLAYSLACYSAGRVALPVCETELPGRAEPGMLLNALRAWIDGGCDEPEAQAVREARNRLAGVRDDRPWLRRTLNRRPQYAVDTILRASGVTVVHQADAPNAVAEGSVRLAALAVGARNARREIPRLLAISMLQGCVP